MLQDIVLIGKIRRETKTYRILLKISGHTASKLKIAITYNLASHRPVLHAHKFQSSSSLLWAFLSQVGNIKQVWNGSFIGVWKAAKGSLEGGRQCTCFAAWQQL